MTDKINGQISAFIDDELMDEESELLIRRLCNDASLRETAARYTLIGDAVRGSLDEIRADLNGSIMRAIEREPAPIAVPAAARGRDWRQFAAGGAMAAAVAVIAVLAIRPGTPVDAPRVASQALTGVVVPDSTAPANPLATRVTPVLLRAGNQAQLEKYVLRHNQFSKTTLRQGVLVFRSVAGEESRSNDEPGNTDVARRNAEQP